MLEIFTLLVIFQTKHLLCDFPLQTSYMLRKFLPGWAWVLPLTAHAATHALFTFFILSLYRLYLGDASVYMLALMLAAADFAVHFAMDRIKASPNLLGRFKALSAKEYPESNTEQKRQNTLFWWSLGFDQYVHGLTDTAIVYFLITRT